MMRSVLGLNRTTDASVCLLDDERIELLIRKERLTRAKHAIGALGDLEMYLAAIGRDDVQLDAVVQCFSSDRERAKIAEYRREIETVLPLRKNAVIAEISHHFSHAYCAFFPTGFEEAAILIADNRGSPQDLVGETPFVLDGAGTGALEVITAFTAERRTIRAIARQWWTPGEKPTGLGMFYSTASWALFDREYCEGIVMGLAPFGDPHRLKLPPLRVEGVSVHVGTEWLQTFANLPRFGFLRGQSGSFADCADLAAATQHAFEEALVAVAKNVRSMTGAKRLVYAGGCALNCSANARLVAEAGFSEVFIPPPCDDGGTSLGCAIFGQHLLSPAGADVKWTTDYLGPSRQMGSDSLRARAGELGFRVLTPDDLVTEVAGRLSEGQVLALFQGRSESGARALGNRSLLAEPRFEATRNYINSSVKGREWFRPLAPVVRLEDAGKYFDSTGESPYMQRTASVRPEWRSSLLGVCHVDGTVRMQTVTPQQNAFMYELLGRFEERTGTGVVLNTSFNGKNQPIVETEDEALLALRDLPMHGLIIPPFLIEPQETRRSPLAI